MRRVIMPIVFFLIVFISCEQDNYEKGEGRYSLMRGDFAELRIDADLRATTIVTDDLERLSLKEPYTANNKVDDKAEVISMGQVPCPPIVSLDEFEEKVCTDPVKLESIWLSKSGKYLNMSLQLKTGHTDDTTAVQHLAFVSDTLLVNPDKTQTLYVRLHHDQGNVPEYYSIQSYVSLPTDKIPADSVRLIVNTYSGLIVRTLQLPKR